MRLDGAIMFAPVRIYAVAIARGRRDPDILIRRHIRTDGRDLSEAGRPPWSPFDTESVLVHRVVTPGEIDLRSGCRRSTEIGWRSRRRACGRGGYGRDVRIARLDSGVVRANPVAIGCSYRLSKP